MRMSMQSPLLVNTCTIEIDEIALAQCPGTDMDADKGIVFLEGM